MLPPGAAPAPIAQIAAAQRIAVAIMVVHPHPVTGVIIIVVPAAAEADADEAAAIIARIIAVIAITVVIGIDRKRVVSGKSGSVRVDLGGRRILKKKKKTLQ